MPKKEKTVFEKTVDGGKWITIGIVVQRVINLVTFVTLARILAPETYGIMIAATLMVGVISTLFEPGFGTVFLQEKENVTKYLNAAWTFEIVKGLILGLLMCAISPFIAKFFQIEGYELVICFGGLLLFLQGAANIGQFFIFKEIQLKKIFIRDLVQQLSYLVVALTWVAFNPTVWALVAGNVASYASGTIMSYVIHPYRPKLDFRLRKLGKLFKKTKWVIGTNTLNYISNIIDTTFLGHLLGPANMGVYSKARDISIIPSSYLNQLTMKAGFPAMAKIQDELGKVRDGFFKMIDVTLLISIPFLAVLIFEADRIVPLFLGEKWVDMVIPLKLLAIAMTIKGVTNIANPIFYGLGEFSMRFKTVLVQVLVMAVSLLYAVPKYGLKGAGYAVIGSFVIVFIYTFMKLIPLIKINILKTIPGVIITGGSGVLTVLLAWPFEEFLHAVHGIAYLAGLTLLGGIYMILVFGIGYLTKAGPYATIVQTLKVLKR
ncbi:MAG: lipopolysaccharide biosynthesis protein [Patescibacteria group bacterium]|nr:lipopolysaccharide biosynthesis protein [Patescibacteria group bacterium]